MFTFMDLLRLISHDLRFTGATHVPHNVAQQGGDLQVIGDKIEIAASMSPRARASRMKGDHTSYA